MKKSFQRISVLITSLILIALAGGCEDQNLLNIKKARLIAAENIQLKKDISQRDKEIEEQKMLVEKCKQEKKRTGKMMIDMTTAKLDDIKRIVALEKENKELKTEIENLKKQPQSPEPNTPEQTSVK